jgi:hypothetical protein
LFPEYFTKFNFSKLSFRLYGIDLIRYIKIMQNSTENLIPRKTEQYLSKNVLLFNCKFSYRDAKLEQHAQSVHRRLATLNTRSKHVSRNGRNSGARARIIQISESISSRRRIDIFLIAYCTNRQRAQVRKLGRQASGQSAAVVRRACLVMADFLTDYVIKLRKLNYY